METAIVGVFGALVGILLSNGLALLLDVRRRRERVKDVQTSIRAEIRTHWRRFDPAELNARSKAMVARMGEGDFSPFIPKEGRRPVFDAVDREQHVLPTSVIDPVVLFYSHYVALTQFVEDMRSELFLSLEADRKLQMYVDHVAMQNQARGLAEEAIRVIDSSLRENEPQ